MEYVSHCGLSISRIGLGTRGLGGPGCDEGKWAQVIGFALDSGVNLIDTAPLYQNGSSEELLGRLLKGKRNEVLLSTKVGTHGLENSLTPQAIKETVATSLKRLGTDYIDILHVHYPDPRAGYQEVAALLQKLQQEGVIRQYGLSNFDKRELTRWPKAAPPISMQLAYNLLQWQQYRELEPLLAERNIVPLVYTPLATGMLALPPEQAQETQIGKMLYGGLSEQGKEKLAQFFAYADENEVSAAELALAWSLKEERNIALVGTGKVEHLKQALNALDLCNSELVAILEPIPQPVLPFAARVKTVLKTTEKEALVELELAAMAVVVAAWVKGSPQAGDTFHLDGLTGQVIEE